MPTITETTVIDLLNNPPFRILPASKQLTLAFGGIYIASTTVAAKPLLVWETERGYPRYYISTESLHDDIKPHIRDSFYECEIFILGKEATMGGTGRVIPSPTDGPQAVIERLRMEGRWMSWVRFLKGPLEGFIRFERSETGK